MAVAYVAVGSQLQGTGDLAPPWPVHTTDDIGVLPVVSSQQAVVLSPDGGFVEGVSYDGGGSPLTPLGLGAPATSGSLRLTWFWCRATSGAMPTPTVLAPGSFAICRIFTIRGCSTSGFPWDGNPTADIGSPATAGFTFLTGSTSVDGCLLGQIVCNAIDAAPSQVTWTANPDLTGFAERFDSNTSAGTGGGVGLATGSKTLAGAFSSTVGTFLASTVSLRLTIAFRPPVVGTPVVFHDHMTTVSQAISRGSRW